MATSQRTYLVTALVCAASAVYIAWVAASRSADLSAPPGIAYLAAFIFALAAFRLLQLRMHPEHAGDGFAVLLFTAMSLLGGWIAFGAGPRACTGSIGELDGLPIGGLGCRIPFGIGAVFTAFGAIYCAARLMREWRTPVRSPEQAPRP